MSPDDLALDMEFAKFDLSRTSVKSAYPGGYGGRVDRHRTGKRIASGLTSTASLGLTGRPALTLAQRHCRALGFGSICCQRGCIVRSHTFHTAKSGDGARA